MFISGLECWLSIVSKKPVVFLVKMNLFLPLTRHCLGTDFREPLGEQCKPPTFALATKRFRAIDLSCRACDACGAGVGCWAWIPGGGLRSAPCSPPTSDLFDTYRTKLKLDKEVGGGDLQECGNCMRHRIPQCTPYCIPYNTRNCMYTPMREP